MNITHFMVTPFEMSKLLAFKVEKKEAKRIFIIPNFWQDILWLMRIPKMDFSALELLVYFKQSVYENFLKTLNILNNDWKQITVQQV